MPQFELDVTSAAAGSADAAPRLVRGRSAEDAVRRALALEGAAVVEVGEAAQGSGWSALHVDGEARGRVRPRDRMRFRRD